MARKHAAHRQRTIQKQVAKADKTRPKEKNGRAMQAGVLLHLRTATDNR
jgi:hypothetical protein